MLPPGDALSLPVLPGESPGVPGDLTAGPEVGSPVRGHQSEEVLGLLLGVQGDHLHALGLAVLSATIPVKVVSMISPGQKVTLSLPLVISLWLGGHR